MLSGEKFTSKDEQPYCGDCYGDLFAKKCCRCTKAITGGLELMFEFLQTLFRILNKMTIIESLKFHVGLQRGMFLHPIGHLFSILYPYLNPVMLCRPSKICSIHTKANGSISLTITMISCAQKTFESDTKFASPCLQVLVEPSSSLSKTDIGTAIASCATSAMPPWSGEDSSWMSTTLCVQTVGDSKPLF